MGSENDCDALDVELVEEVNNAVCGVWVQVAGGFVGDYEARLMDECAGNCDALFFTSRKHVWEVVACVRQANFCENFWDAGFNLFVGVAANFHGKGHVFVSGAFWEQFVILEHNAEFAAVFLEGQAIETRDVVSVHQDVAMRERDCTDKCVDESCFPGAG